MPVEEPGASDVSIIRRVFHARGGYHRAKVRQTDGTGAKNDGSIIRAAHHRRLEPDRCAFTFENARNASIEILNHGLPGRGARPTGAIC
jgi:hypothetical protein